LSPAIADGEQKVQNLVLPALEVAPLLPKRRAAEYAEFTGYVSNSPQPFPSSGCPDSILASAIEHVAYIYASRGEKFHVC
jgi:hypothetical protein